MTDAYQSKAVAVDDLEARAVGSACLCLSVRKAARRMARLYDDALSPVGLTNGQFALLTMLSARSDWTMQALAEALGTDPSSLTAALKPLARRGLVQTSPGEADRRKRLPALSEAGAALLDQALPFWRGVQAQAEAVLGKSAADRLRHDLARLA